MYRRCTCVIATNLRWPRSQKGHPSCNFSKLWLHCAKLDFFNSVLLQSCIFSILHFWKHAVCQTKSKSKWKLWSVAMPGPWDSTHVHTHTHKLLLITFKLLWWYNKLTHPIIKAASTSRPTCTSLVSIYNYYGIPISSW